MLFLGNSSFFKEQQEHLIDSVGNGFDSFIQST